MTGNYRYISSTQKENIFLLSRDLKPVHIARHLRVSVRTVYRVLGYVSEHGDVPRPLRTGRPSLLDALDSLFLESLVERTPDITLFELQEELELKRGIWVGEDTISRTLKKRGWTRKKVCDLSELSYSG
ncbi:hypothetical protein K435DRAFT_678765 [Dendrothele bispora CBS 962.96]|uniref:Homeodomain-like protein n=1 Tax=Dendrothele bispora (strain CBS 962.96) TaxID=1314807 RepID=A0A4S8LJB4_DENBC|nr:hypothetical protein K435DRAFT_678765 [Dendrothele bispora CBS 962.96]